MGSRRQIVIRGAIAPLLVLMATACSTSTIAEVESASTAPAPAPTSSTSMTTALLSAHNRYRTEVGISPLQWSDTLAASAQSYAETLAASNRFAHSDTDGYGENLWKGTAGAYSMTDMVNSWGEEKAYFIPNAPFPEVSTTDNWQDVGHYTQIIWEATTEVGCGLATGSGWDILVCHYSPPGNFVGQQPY